MGLFESKLCKLNVVVWLIHQKLS